MKKVDTALFAAGATRSTLAQPLDDCSFSFGLNVNQTNQAWLLDNLRFTP